MLSVSIQELKQGLSALIARARRGERILITRHNRPVAWLHSADLAHVHVGGKVGKRPLRALLGRGSRGAYLRVLLEDRQA